MEWEAYLPLILTWGLALAASGMLGFALWSLRWPSVKGLIEVSFLDAESGRDASSGSKSTTLFKKESESHALAYSYEVGGVKYLGSNVKPWGDSDWSLRSGGDTDLPDSGKILWSGARDAARWYRPGAIVDVYYCPWRPQWACLEPAGFIVPLLLGGAAVLLYWFVLR